MVHKIFSLSIWDVYLQVFLARESLIDKMRLFLKPPNIDKKWLVAFHSLWNKEFFYSWEMHESVDDLDLFSAVTNWQLLPTDSC